MHNTPGTPEPQTAAILQAVAASGLPPLHALDPIGARKAYEERVARTNVASEPIAYVEDLLVPRRDGGELPLRLYRPVDGERRPLLLYFHGGGFVIGNLATHDPICRYLAAHSGWSVIAVDYRLAPEDRFPAAVHDAQDAFDWVWAHAASLQIDLGRIAVAGDSAGGTLAASVAQHARRLNRRLFRQILIYPALDQGGDYPSRATFSDQFLLTRESIEWFAQHYYGHSEPELDPSASPARSTQLGGLAPAWIVTAELDPLRDEAAHYARLLEAAGVATHYRCIQGVIHGFLGMARYVSVAHGALDDLAASLRHVTMPVGDAAAINQIDEERRRLTRYTT